MSVAELSVPVVVNTVVVVAPAQTVRGQCKASDTLVRVSRTSATSLVVLAMSQAQVSKSIVAALSVQSSSSLVEPAIAEKVTVQVPIAMVSVSAGVAQTVSVCEAFVSDTFAVIGLAVNVPVNAANVVYIPKGAIYEKSSAKRVTFATCFLKRE